MPQTYYKVVHYKCGSYYEGMGYDFDGEFIYHGKGKFFNTWEQCTYEGTFVDGVLSGKGRRYYKNGTLQYEGSFLNGEFHGHGTTYFFTSQIDYDGDFVRGKYSGTGVLYQWSADGVGKRDYEGQFLDGKKCGKGKSYNRDGTLYYEGDFYDGRYNGTGTAYHPSGRIIYKGLFKDGHAFGLGTGFADDGYTSHTGFYINTFIYYEGPFLNGVPHGKGKLYCVPRILVYDGDFLNGERTGRGRYYRHGTLCYEGGLLNGVFQDSGVEYDKDGKAVYSGVYVQGQRYTGETVGGQASGYGTLHSDDGILRYEGRFLAGQKHGEGKEYICRGKEDYQVEFEGVFAHGQKVFGKSFSIDGKLRYIGEFQNGRPKGQGTLFRQGVLYYQGSVSGYMPHGRGKEYSEDGMLYYEGEFANGCRNGMGKEYDEEQRLIYEGSFVNDRRMGMGMLYAPDGKRVYRGEFRDDYPWGQGTEFAADGTTPVYTGKFVDCERAAGHAPNHQRSGNISECISAKRKLIDRAKRILNTCNYEYQFETDQCKEEMKRLQAKWKTIGRAGDQDKLLREQFQEIQDQFWKHTKLEAKRMRLLDLSDALGSLEDDFECAKIYHQWNKMERLVGLIDKKQDAILNLQAEITQLEEELGLFD